MSNRKPLRPLLLGLAVALVGGLAAVAVAPATASRGPVDPLAQPTPLARSAQAPQAEAPTARTLYRNGPDGRFLLGGTWLYRFDSGGGAGQGYQRSTSTAGWRGVTVPNAWNATDVSVDSFVGTVGWYRKDFTLPSTDAGLTWIVRFESVNYRAIVWLNGHEIGRHAGAYLPFELELPARHLSRGGVNHLVIRVDNRRTGTDFPPAGISSTGAQEGGWWNYGGLLREVYVRRVRRIDFDSVQVLPQLPCGACSARVDYHVVVHNYATTPQRVAVVGRYGGRPVRLGAHTVGARQTAAFAGSVPVAHPTLWSPDHPYLYDATLDASAAPAKGGTFVAVAHYFLQSGIRSIRVVGGHLLLNGHQLNLRGVGLHEDSPDQGFAIDNTTRARFISETKDLGATLIRAHYPLHPYLQELADQMGIMLWSEVPVYQIKTPHLNLIRAPAVALLQHNILTNGNHPSVIVWSIGNELSAKVGPAQTAYIRQATAAAHALDPTRPVGLAVAGYPSAGCQAGYQTLDVIGLNDYFGWYIGPGAQIADPSLLGPFLDQQRACYPHKALVVTEFGAEADRHGPVDERGTYEFQQAFVRYHLGVYASKPYLSGATYWALEEFRVRPGWVGGNPHPNPPLHEKGLITFGGASKKPAYADVQSIYRSTQQVR